MGIALGFSFFQLQSVSTDVKSIVSKAIESNKNLKEQNDRLKAQLEALNTKTGSPAPSTPTQELKPIPIVTISKGTTSGITEPSNIVIKKSEKFEETWNQIYSTRGDIPTIPDIDFSKADVIAVFNGEKPNLCYDITVQGVQMVSHMGHFEEDVDERVVFIIKTEPDEGAVCGQAITQAYHLVAVPQWPFEVTFEVWTEKIK